MIAGSESDGIVTSSEFSTRKDEKDREVLMATIQLENVGGQAISDREVNYELRLNARSSAKGKGSSDSEGRVQLEFATREALDVKQGVLTLYIMNGDQPPVLKRIAVEISNPDPVVEFYAESGTLLSEEPTRVGVFSLLPNGKPVAVAGEVYDQDENKVAEFTTNELGVANFTMIPKSSARYTARVSYESRSAEGIPLPPVADQGVQLFARAQSDGSFLVQATIKEEGYEGREFALIAQNSGQVFYAVKVRLEGNKINIKLPAGRLPSGVSKLALLDDQMNFLAGRSVFTQLPEDLLALQLSAAEQTVGLREPVEVNMQVDPQAEDSATNVAVFSVAVTNLSKVPDSAVRQPGILGSLMLESDITHPLEDIESLRLGQEDVQLEKIDQLLLLEEADKTFWEDRKKGKMPELEFPPEKQLRISGRVINDKGEPAEKAKVTVLSLENTGILDTITGADGRFTFDKILFYENTNFIVQARDARGRKNVQVELDSVPQQKVTAGKNAPQVTVDASASAGRFQQDSTRSLDDWQKYGYDERSIILDEVEVKGQKKENPARHSANLNGPGNADQVISGDEIYFQGCPSLDMCLQGRLVGVIFRGGVPYSSRSPNQPMQIILDGVYMGADALRIVPPVDVASVEILRTIGNTAIYGSWGGGGVMIITTRRGDQPPRWGERPGSTAGLTSFRQQGYYEVRPFPMVDYGASGQEEAGREPARDDRTTIFWEPNILTEGDGKASFRFYTADDPGTYQVVVEGLDAQGRLVRKITYIQVKD